VLKETLSFPDGEHKPALGDEVRKYLLNGYASCLSFLSRGRFVTFSLIKAEIFSFYVLVVRLEAFAFGTHIRQFAADSNSGLNPFVPRMRKRIQPIDIDTIKRAQQLAENIVATVREPLLVLDASLRVQAASRSFYQLFHLTPEVTERRIFYELGKGQWNNPDLRRRLEQVLEKDESFNDYSITHDFEGLGRRIMLLNARPLIQDNEQKPLILLAIEDVTTREEFTKCAYNRG
jgi:PAS domain-containing protein